MHRQVSLAAGLFMLMAAPASAQQEATQPGSWLLGGSLSYSSTGGDELEDRTNTTMLAPSVVRFVSHGFGLGVQTEVSRVSQGDLVDVSHAYLGKLTYVFPTDSRVRPVISAGGGFIRLSTNDENSNASINGWAMRLAGGAFFFLNEHYALVAELDYAYNKFLISEGNDPATDTVILALGFTGFVF
ncbi:porin family protein [bacterium]|nr:porin family protein [bacterium]